MSLKGNIPWNKGMRGIHLSPETEFKKGIIPWNKGLIGWNSGENNPAYKDGRTLRKYYCVDCGKELFDYKAKRCRSCAARITTKKRWQDGEFYIKSGKDSPNYKDGKCLQKNYCIDCGKEIGFRAIRCGSCANRLTTKEKWQESEYREKMSKVLVDIQSPTNPEKEIMRMLEELELDYVFQFRPKDYLKIYDFYIPDMNLLIEFDGIYWHSLEKSKLRDKEKTQYAKDNGYNLLRCDENNLEGFESVILKIIRKEEKSCNQLCIG